MNLCSSLSLASETPLQKQQLRKTRTIWQLLNDSPDSSQFRHPVAWQTLQLQNYPQIVKHPMDLQTINFKMQDEKYRFVQEILDDIQLIWDNCKLYNESGSWIYLLADKMDRYFKKLIRNYFSNVVITQSFVRKGGQDTPVLLAPIGGISCDPSTPRVTNRRKQSQKIVYSQEDLGQDRGKLADRMRKLSAQQLGELVQLVMDECPKAMKLVDEGKYTLRFSLINEWLCGQMFKRISELTMFEQRAKKVKV